MVVSFEGVYPMGSLGRYHGAYIARETLSGLYLYEPDCVILDFRDMEYTWGDNLSIVYRDVSEVTNRQCSEGQTPFPLLTVVSDKCEEALLSLKADNFGKSISDHIYRDLEEAIAQGIKLAQERLNNQG